MGSGKKVTVGYKYHLGVHMILGHGPFDAITKIEIDDRVAWTGNQTSNGTISIDAEELFGGEEREGGVSGDVDLAFGGPSQTRNSYLQSVIGTNIPAFRGVVGVVLNQVYMGMNPYLKPWGFWARRTQTKSNGQTIWYSAKATINSFDMNPAHIIYECLTDTNWGMGYNESDLDLTAFEAAADTLYDEEMGMSLLWSKSQQIDEFIKIVLDHIDGALFVDRTTGKFVLKLVRDDYVLASLPVLGEDDINRISNVRAPTISELTNSVSVVYWNGTDGSRGSVTVPDIALIGAMGSVVSTTRQYPGFSNGTNASKAAARDLRALSTPLRSCTIYTNRTGADLNVGDAFKLDYPRYGFDETVMRVSEIELGTLESNIVKISCIEDVFATGASIYAVPAGSSWTSPVNAPEDMDYVHLIEAPYWEIVQVMGQTVAEDLDATSTYFVVTGVAPTADAQYAKLEVNRGGNYEEAASVDFCGTALVDSPFLDVTKGALTIPIKDGVNLDTVEEGTYAMIGTEAVRVDAITATEITVGRGCLDTVPQEHADETRIFFADDYYQSDGVEYLATENVTVKLLPVTGQGKLAEASATPRATGSLVARQYKPYPPGRFRINEPFIAAGYYPEDIANDVDCVLYWSHRDRLQQTVIPIEDESASSIGPETNVLYQAEIRTLGGTLIASSYDINNSTHTFTTGDLGSNYGPLRVILWTTRDGLASLQTIDHIIRRGQYEWGLSGGSDELEFNDGTIGVTGAAVFDPTP